MTVEEERDLAWRQIEAVMALHQSTASAIEDEAAVCHECLFPWPCATARALGVTG